MNWTALTEISQIDECILLSDEKTIAIFKHSTSCGISRMVLRGFEREVDSLDSDDVHYYFLDLIKYRNVSNYIADKLSVIHESPQFIVIKNGAVKHHSSHSNISPSYTS